MPLLIELTVAAEDLEYKVGSLLRNRLFHFTSGVKFKSIQNTGHILPYSSSLEKTSIHSNESVGRHLDAVCLFDLRNKTPEQIAPGKSYYNYLAPRTGDSLVYLILSQDIYGKITTVDQLDKAILESKMYLPEIESWHKGSLSIENLEKILVVTVVA